MITKRFTSPLLLLMLLSACDGGLLEVTEPGALVPRTVDQDASLPSLALNGTLLHVRSFGSPQHPLLLVIHGGPGGDFRPLLAAQAFTDDGFQVVFYDQRGTGLSRREARSQFEQRGALDMMIADLDALITHFNAAGARKVFLIGHSWGAMLATGYISRHPTRISGAVLAEPGGFTWAQASEYSDRVLKLRPFSEGLNDGLFPDHIFAGRSEHEVLDYKAGFTTDFENAPGNPVGNPSPYPFWRPGAVASRGLITHAERYGFDLATGLAAYTTEVLLLYSELNRAYGPSWAAKMAAAYPNARLDVVKGSGHEMLYFGWPDFYRKSLAYLESVR
jgi:proline iminopeptidase